jgi:biopolymer transport protein ExbD
MLPLVDVIFLLLIFFIYSMVTMVSGNTLQIDLPKACGNNNSGHGAIVLSIDGQSSVYINKKPVSFESLPREFERESLEKGGRAVFIEGHKKSDLETTVKVISLLRSLGVKEVFFGCDELETP